MYILYYYLQLIQIALYPCWIIDIVWNYIIILVNIHTEIKYSIYINIKDISRTILTNVYYLLIKLQFFSTLPINTLLKICWSHIYVHHSLGVYDPPGLVIACSYASQLNFYYHNGTLHYLRVMRVIFGHRLVIIQYSLAKSVHIHMYLCIMYVFNLQFKITHTCAYTHTYVNQVCINLIKFDRVWRLFKFKENSAGYVCNHLHTYLCK